MNKSKECNRCHKNKTLNEYYSYEKIKANGQPYIYYYPYCINCAINKATKWNSDNKEQFERNRRKHWETDLYKAYEKRNFEKKKAKGYFKKWRQNNKDKIKQYIINRELHKNHDISDEEINMLYEYADSCCMYCGMPEEDSLVVYGQKLHRDHAINYGSDRIDNCLLSCKGCNSSKRTKDWDEWYTPKNGRFDYYRYEKIIEWFSNFQ